MKTRELIIGLLIIGALAILITRTSGVVYNQRINSEENNMQNTETESKLTNYSNDEVLGETKLDKLETVTKEEGSGEEVVKEGDNISVHYRGWLASDGTVFDTSLNRGETFSFNVGSGVIEGWSLGVVGMKVGEVRRLKIPSNLGYGESGAGDVIGANADLIFDVELVSINK